MTLRLNRHYYDRDEWAGPNEREPPDEDEPDENIPDAIRDLTMSDRMPDCDS
jgi:hypothetical protein